MKFKPFFERRHLTFSMYNMMKYNIFSDRINLLVLKSPILSYWWVSHPLHLVFHYVYWRKFKNKKYESPLETSAWRNRAEVVKLAQIEWFYDLASSLQVARNSQRSSKAEPPLISYHQATSYVEHCFFCEVPNYSFELNVCL